jgi:FkbM family methyltransferase
MKKVFIDCGANVGQSLMTFKEYWNDYNDYEIHSFEALPLLANKVIEMANTLNLKNFKFHPEAVSTEDGKVDFYISKNNGNYYGSSLESTKETIILDNKVIVDAIDLAKWITDRYSKEDFIVLKIDIEGTEYRLLKHLFNTGVINYCNDVYVEFHLDNKVKIDQSLRDEVNLLIANIDGPTKIHTDTSRGLKFR